ncbi:AAA family ATPase [Terasakiella sp. A23]|uniref:bifunctional aminoglycoside phosphotransferase/ATP-binding protein n=1 Tax=Terasakiella sp. FCG-A23 TaxID=3080561 RepID=UPI0029543D06|nr:AAA family ATPase [Terasakiella sp. A23]MDV7339253.1 AAA family ATPase [Terasakiella sp. A23]
MHQEDVIDFLSHPDAYGLPDEQEVERFDTHISIVFLAGDFAYKLKRAIALPFVDFRALEDRHHFCKQELSVNNFFAGNLYQDVIPVTCEGDELSLDGAGEPVDYLVKMHRFDQASLYNVLCDQGQLSTQMIHDLCDQAVAFYDQAEIDKEYGGVAGMVRAFEGHYKAIENCPDHILDEALLDRLKSLVAETIERHKSLLDERQIGGYVRHCHGDLHLRNICQYQSQTLVFDAIEFEPDFAVIDMFYDFAFLLMDLCHRGEMDLANKAMNRYLGCSGDMNALYLSGLFLASRSAIRMHVNGVASQNQQTEAARLSLEQDARSYLTEALEYLSPKPVILIAIGGLSGSGKSVLSQKLAPHWGRQPGAFIARTDMIRKRLQGVRPQDRLDQTAYSPEVTEQTYETLYYDMTTALKAGQCVIVDGVFAREEERAKLQNYAEELNIPFVGIWLDAAKETLKQRVAARVNDPSDATVEIVELQQSYDLGVMDWHRIDVSQDFETIYQIVRSHLLEKTDFPL